MLRIYSSLFALFVFISCNKSIGPSSVTTTEDILIIGLTFGECGGDCQTLYKLEDGKIYRDLESGYWNGSSMLNFSDISIENKDAEEEMAQLLANFPQFFLDSTEQRFGCPDCGDWGAIPVVLFSEDGQRTWIVDNDNKGNPKELQDWVNDAQDLMEDLWEQ